MIQMFVLWAHRPILHLKNERRLGHLIRCAKFCLLHVDIVLSSIEIFILHISFSFLVTEAHTYYMQIMEKDFKFFITKWDRNMNLIMITSLMSTIQRMEVNV